MPTLLVETTFMAKALPDVVKAATCVDTFESSYTVLSVESIRRCETRRPPMG
jgi:hypothetical protein